MNGNKIALDTTDAIAVLNAANPADGWLQGYDEFLLPVTVVGELTFGAPNSGRVEENLRRVGELVARCRVLDVDLSIARVYAEIRLDLKKKGTPIPENDIWIAAVCKQHGLPLASTDDHFAHVDGLVVIRRT
jgi:tRNA(fMet)-specific endonuclease VapC